MTGQSGFPYGAADEYRLEMEVKPVPAFYCCYLLRSTVRHASVYVGSTPNPVRRLAQHNGIAKGGAVRTSRLNLRPWEMTCIVSGFKSQIAALQFEWAWQNSHLTRHITPDDRISFPTTRTKSSSKTGRARKKPGRPRTSLRDKLANLHILLRSNYFSKWPLEVRFFSTDVYEAWQQCCDDAAEPVSQHLQIQLDVKASPEDEVNDPGAPKRRRRKEDDYGKGGIEGLDITYASLRNVLEKSQFLIADGETLDCTVCRNPLSLTGDLIVTCPGDDCNALSHVSCLSKHFLSGINTSMVIPDKGHCPSCHTQLQWQDLMTEMTLRLRAPKEVKKVLSKKSKGSNISVPMSAAEEAQEEEEEDAESDAMESGPTAAEIAQLGDERDGDEYDDNASVASTVSEITPKKIQSKQPPRKRRLPSVVEESDWEGAEIIE